MRIVSLGSRGRRRRRIGHLHGELKLGSKWRTRNDPIAGSSVRPPGSEPVVMDAVCAPTPPKILLGAEHLPTTPSGSVKERIVNVAAGNAIPYWQGAPAYGTRLFNTKFCMSAEFVTLARMTPDRSSPGATSNRGVCDRRIRQLGSPRLAAGVNTGWGRRPLLCFRLCAKVAAIRDRRQILLHQMSCNSRHWQGARWKSFTAVRRGGMPYWSAGTGVVKDVFVIAGFVMEDS